MEYFFDKTCYLDTNDNKVKKSQLTNEEEVLFQNYMEKLSPTENKEVAYKIYSKAIEMQYLKEKYEQKNLNEGIVTDKNYSEDWIISM